jgi:hypothetical protein
MRPAALDPPLTPHHAHTHALPHTLLCHALRCALPPQKDLEAVFLAQNKRLEATLLSKGQLVLVPNQPKMAAAPGSAAKK